MATILITGGTGTIGSHLTKLLIKNGHVVIILSRGSSSLLHPSPGISFSSWDIEKQTIAAEAIAQADHIIHLAGAGVADKRWSKERKQEIINSRTRSSALIVKALGEMPNQVQTVVSASAIGWYGADTAISRQQGFTEELPADNEFLGETCRLWEESIQPVELLGKRLVKLRAGIVLSNEGGALPEYKKPLKAGVAAIPGNGQQVVSWIHADDLCRMYLRAIEDPQMHGAYNAVTPFPVTNKNLTLALAKKMRNNFYIPVHVPSVVLKMVLGEMSIEVLKSATVSCRKIEAAGFVFLYPTVEKALMELIKQ